MGDDLLHPLFGDLIQAVAIDGRAVEFRQQIHRGNLVSRTLIVFARADGQGGDAGGYRGGPVRELEIDPILVRKETRVDRFGKRVGLNLEVQLGDPAVDDTLYFETKTAPAVVKDLFSARELQRAVVGAVGCFDKVLLAPPIGLVACSRTTNAASLVFEDPLVQRAILGVADAMPAVRLRADRDKGRRVFLPVLAFALGVALLIAAVNVGSAGALVAPLVLSPMLVGVLATPIASLLVARPLSAGRSDGLRVFVLATCATLLALVCLAIAAFNFGNRMLDTSSARELKVEVVSITPRDRHGTGGNVRVRGMPTAYAPSDSAGVTTISANWMVPSSCTHISLLMHPGLFGLPWVEDWKCSGWIPVGTTPAKGR